MERHLADVITCAKFQNEIFRGYNFTGGRISHFSYSLCMGLTTAALLRCLWYNRLRAFRSTAQAVISYLAEGSDMAREMRAAYVVCQCYTSSVHAAVTLSRHWRIPHWMSVSENLSQWNCIRHNWWEHWTDCKYTLYTNTVITMSVVHVVCRTSYIMIRLHKITSN